MDSCGQFRILYGIPEVREVSKNLPGARGFVFPKYRPIPSHGDPIHARNDLNFVSQITYVVQLSVKLSLVFLFWAGTFGVLDLSKKMRIEIQGGGGYECLHLIISDQRLNYIGFCMFEEGGSSVYCSQIQDPTSLK